MLGGEGGSNSWCSNDGWRWLTNGPKGQKSQRVKDHGVNGPKGQKEDQKRSKRGLNGRFRSPAAPSGDLGRGRERGWRWRGRGWADLRARIDRTRARAHPHSYPPHARATPRIRLRAPKQAHLETHRLAQRRSKAARTSWLQLQHHALTSTVSDVVSDRPNHVSAATVSRAVSAHVSISLRHCQTTAVSGGLRPAPAGWR